jgi:hypothetical protein
MTERHFKILNIDNTTHNEIFNKSNADTTLKILSHVDK